MSLSLLNQIEFIKFKLDNSNDEYVSCKYAPIKDAYRQFLTIESPLKVMKNAFHLM